LLQNALIVPIKELEVTVRSKKKLDIVNHFKECS